MQSNQPKGGILEPKTTSMHIYISKSYAEQKYLISDSVETFFFELEWTRKCNWIVSSKLKYTKFRYKFIE